MADPACKLQKFQGAGNIFSHSGLEAFASCPRKWHGTYVLGLRDAPSEATAYGHLVHAVASAAVRAAVENDPSAPSAVPIVDALPGFVAAARHRYAAEERLVPETRDAEIIQSAVGAVCALPDGVHHLLVEDVILQPLLPPSKVKGIDVDLLEKTLREADAPAADFGKAWGSVQAVLRSHGANAFQVKPDLVVVLEDGRIILRDWKTTTPSRNERPQDKLQRKLAEYTPQLRRYAAVGRRRWGQLPICDLQFFNFGPEPVQVSAQPEEVKGAAQDIGNLVNEIATAAARGEAAFEQRIGDACRYRHLAKLGACAEGAALRRGKGWDRWDVKDARARIAAGIEWDGDAAARGLVGADVGPAGAAGTGEALPEDTAVSALAAQNGQADEPGVPATDEGSSETPGGGEQADQQLGAGAAQGESPAAEAQAEAGNAPEPAPAPSSLDEARQALRNSPGDPSAAPDATEAKGWRPAEAVQIALAICTLEAAAKRWGQEAKALREGLHTWVSAHGALDVEAMPEAGVPAGRWAVTRGNRGEDWTDDVLSLEAALEAAKLDPGDYIIRKPDAKALGKAITDPETRKLLEPLFTMTEGEPVLRFTPTKAAKGKAATPGDEGGSDGAAPEKGQKRRGAA